MSESNGHDAEGHEDIVAAEIVKRRERRDTGERITLEELADDFGIDLTELEDGAA